MADDDRLARPGDKAARTGGRHLSKTSLSRGREEETMERKGRGGGGGGER